MQAWQKVFRDGLCPLLSDAHLEALREALATDDSRLLQGATSEPRDILAPSAKQDWPCEAACLLGYCGVVDHGGFGPATVMHVEKAVEQLCYQIGIRLGDPRAFVWLMNWFDETPRHEMIANLLPEVRREIERRKGAEASVA